MTTLFHDLRPAQRQLVRRCWLTISAVCRSRWGWAPTSRSFSLANALLLAAAAAQIIRAFLHDVGAIDPAAVVGVPVVPGAVAALATVVPARRALRVEPVEASGRNRDAQYRNVAAPGRTL